MCMGVTNAMFYRYGDTDEDNMVQGRLGLRRIQGSVMTWRLERYSGML